VKDDPINIPANRRGFFYPLITSRVNQRERIKSGEGVCVFGEAVVQIFKSLDGDAHITSMTPI
jgi:hypothetical protein